MNMYIPTPEAVLLVLGGVILLIGGIVIGLAIAALLSDMAEDAHYRDLNDFNQRMERQRKH